MRFMYTGIYEAREPKRRRRRRQLNLPVILLDCIFILLCVVLLGKAAGAIRGDTAPGLVPFLQPTEPIATLHRDQLPPEIFGVADITIYQGDTVAYRSGISVTDGEDPAPSLEVDSSRVDLETPGTYTVTYTAADASGNRASAQATVTVLQRQEGYADLKTISEAAELLLAEILPPEAAVREQVEAIYRWARGNVQYGGRSDRADWRQTGYTVLQERRGDCYGFFAVTKLLFEQLEIPNIDVTKVKNSSKDSDHFWSLVSIDGGESYYHFDATPRVGEGDDFCLVTDAFLDAYSREHKNCHNRDSSLYPATPKEALT